ncbi:MAG: hypothetical protein P8124_05020 [Gammaproteobacteria bacterium]
MASQGCAAGLLWALLACLAAVPATATAASTGTKAPPLVHVRQLNAMSGRLVSRIRAGTAEAAHFRVHVAVYQEMLRELMVDNPQVDRSDRLPNALLMKLVRMAALLQAAAACQTGRDIVCSLTLVNELDRQQRRVGAAVDGLAGARGS